MKNPFRRKPKTRIYGGDSTIHQTGYFDIETHKGAVVAVWFRCQPVLFKQAEVERERATDMEAMYKGDLSESPIPGTISVELEES